MISTILFRPFYDPHSKSTPTAPWGLLYVAAPLVERGVDVTIIDEPVTKDYEQQVRQLLNEKKPVAVGISAMTGEQITYGLKFARFVRSVSDVPVVWGGIHPTLLPEQTLENEYVDYVVAGEGEYSYANLLECLHQGGDPSTVDGVWTIKDGKPAGSTPTQFIDLRTLPNIPYELVDVERYIRRRPDVGSERYFETITSRGCPHPCSFCYIDTVHNRRWRIMEPPVIVEKIKDLQRRFNVDTILFREDNFFVDRKRVEAFAKLLLKEKVKVQWSASCRIDYFYKYQPDFVDLIRDSGACLLTFGVESGNNRILRFIKKFITVDQILEVADKVNRHGMTGSYHFMTGFPTETEEEFLDTCRLIDKMLEIAPKMVARELAVYTPYPGLGLTDECVKLGYQLPAKLEDWTDLDWTNPERPWLTARQTRLIADAQWLIARLWHHNPLYRAWITRRWKQFIKSADNIRLIERPAITQLKKLVQSS